MLARRGAAIMLGSLVALAGVPCVPSVQAQSPSADPTDACSLLTDAEVLAATGAATIAATQAGSSQSAAGYGAGCTRHLEPAGGLPANATLDLEYGFQAPGGRSLFDSQMAVMPGGVHVAGLGDDAFPGQSSDWFAVKGDATLALQYLGIGVTGQGLRRGELAARALTWRIMSHLPGDVASPGAPGPVCVLSADEVGAIVGLPFDVVASGTQNCLYQDAAGDHALDIRLQDPPFGSTDADLTVVGLGTGEATTVAGLPAWTSDEALWVDLGARLLVIQPILEFSSAAAQVNVTDVTRPIAKQVIARLAPDLANPTPVPTPATDQDLASLFPSQLRGAPVEVQTLTGQDVLDQVSGPAADAISSVVAAQGRTIADLSLGVADLFNAADRDGTILAIRLRGADAATFGIPIVLAFQGAPDLSIGQQAATVAGKDILVLDIPGLEPAQTIHAYFHGDVAWFVQAKTCTTYTPAKGCDAEAIDQPLLQEILGKLP